MGVSYIPIAEARGFTTHLDKLVIRRGLLTVKEDELRLYRVKDLSLRESLPERIFGLGTVIVYSTDLSNPGITIVHVPHARQVKELLSNAIEHSRRECGIHTSEMV